MRANNLHGAKTHSQHQLGMAIDRLFLPREFPIIVGNKLLNRGFLLQSLVGARVPANDKSSSTSQKLAY